MLAISTINYRNFNKTCNLLKSIATSIVDLNDVTILVRDHSPVNEIPLILNEIKYNLPLIEICQFIFDPENPGFAYGHNSNFQALNLNQSDIFWILNNDILFNSQNLIQDMQSLCSEKVIIGNLIFTNENKIWYSSGTISRISGDLIIKRDLINSVTQTNFISGCSMMLLASEFQRLGGFSNQFFMYGEDFDFCIRAIENGFSLLVVPTPLYHDVGSGFRRNYSDLYLYENTKNKLIIMRKYKLGIPIFRDILYFIKYIILRYSQLYLNKELTPHRFKFLLRAILKGYKIGLQ